MDRKEYSRRKEYKGTLDEVLGAGATIGGTWHLMIDRFYWGQLLFVNGKQTIKDIGTLLSYRH